MPRSTPEWQGKHDDQAIPPRVRLRVFERAMGKCQSCQRKIVAGDSWQADHIVPLINGGEHREANLQCLCGWCHKVKTAQDVAEKAASARKRMKAAGIAKTKHPLPGSRQSRFKRRMDGTVVDRITGEPV